MDNNSLLTYIHFLEKELKEAKEKINKLKEDYYELADMYVDATIGKKND